ncbi:MAG: hypothetical protein ACI4A5_08915 [Hominilimicola sp.]
MPSPGTANQADQGDAAAHEDQVRDCLSESELNARRTRARHAPQGRQAKRQRSGKETKIGMTAMTERPEACAFLAATVYAPASHAH